MTKFCKEFFCLLALTPPWTSLMNVSLPTSSKVHGTETRDEYVEYETLQALLEKLELIALTHDQMAMRLMKILKYLIQVYPAKTMFNSMKYALKYQDPTQLYGDLRWIGRLLSVSRHQLNIEVSCKSVAMGNMTMNLTENVNLNFERMQTIPPWHEVTRVQFSFERIVIVEKECALSRIAHGGFTLRNKSLLISGKGYPDLASRKLLFHINNQCPWIPIHLLTDPDPGGMQIARVYMKGSKTYPELGIPTIKSLGFSASDFEDFGDTDDLTENDVMRLKKLLKDDVFGEMALRMLKEGKKSHIDNYLGDLGEFVESRVHESENEHVQTDEEDEAIDGFPQITDEQLKNFLFGLRNEVIVSKFNMNITRHDLNTLHGLNWLNDQVINFYMELIKERAERCDHLPKVHVMNTFFVPNLLKNGYCGVRRWTQNVDIFSYDVIAVPVHVEGVHWCMSIIHMRDKTIKYYDSMGHPNYPVLEALKNYLRYESLDKRQSQYDIIAWPIECVRDRPQQRNGSDCGVFSCMIAEFISRDSKVSFEQEHMQYFRRKMVFEIASGTMIESKKAGKPEKVFKRFF